jgi:chromosomal replication initiator protein
LGFLRRRVCGAGGNEGEGEVLKGAEPRFQGSLEELWDSILERISKLVGSQSFQTWFRPTRLLSFEDGVLLVEGPNQFFVDWLHEHHMEKIEHAARNITGDDTTVRLTSSPPPTRVAPPDKPAGGSMVVRESAVAANNVHLNRRYTFEEFIVGNCNRLAHAGAQAVAKNPAQVYNPLFIYGGAGLGKTHLIQAIGHNILRSHPSLMISYVSTESFVNELIHAIQKGATLEFKKRYRNIDILLIDDIQFLAGKERMQEEFFYTFNALHDANKQIVCTSDRPPKDIPTLEERLRSRFEWGLITDLQPPDLETRIAILRKKVEDEHIQIPDSVIQVIAENVKNNIRELEGSLIKILAFASLTCQEITVAMARDVLRDIMKEPGGREISADSIKKTVSQHFDVPIDSLKSKTRISRVVLARQVAMYLCRNLTGLSLVQIGQRFGGRDHSTVLHSVRKIEKIITSDDSLSRKIDSISKDIRR